MCISVVYVVWVKKTTISINVIAICNFDWQPTLVIQNSVVDEPVHDSMANHDETGVEQV